MSLAISRNVWRRIAQRSHGDSLVFLIPAGQGRLGVPCGKSAKHRGEPAQPLLVAGDGRHGEDDPLGIESPPGRGPEARRRRHRRPAAGWTGPRMPGLSRTARFASAVSVTARQASSSRTAGRRLLVVRAGAASPTPGSAVPGRSSGGGRDEGWPATLASRSGLVARSCARGSVDKLDSAEHDGSASGR